MAGESDGLGVLSCLAIYRLRDLGKSLSLSQLLFSPRKGKGRLPALWGGREDSLRRPCQGARALPSLPHVPLGHSVHGSVKGVSRRSKLNWGRTEKGRNRGTRGSL